MQIWVDTADTSTESEASLIYCRFDYMLIVRLVVLIFQTEYSLCLIAMAFGLFS